jgi:hypothetical protein
MTKEQLKLLLTVARILRAQNADFCAGRTSLPEILGRADEDRAALDLALKPFGPASDEVTNEASSA